MDRQVLTVAPEDCSTASFPLLRVAQLERVRHGKRGHDRAMLHCKAMRVRLRTSSWTHAVTSTAARASCSAVHVSSDALNRVRWMRISLVMSALLTWLQVAVKAPGRSCLTSSLHPSKSFPGLSTGPKESRLAFSLPSCWCMPALSAPGRLRGRCVLAFRLQQQVVPAFACWPVVERKTSEVGSPLLSCCMLIHKHAIGQGVSHNVTCRTSWARTCRTQFQHGSTTCTSART